MRSQHYGKLGVAKLPREVKDIWYSRNDELPELPSHKWSWEYETDPDLWIEQDFARKIIEATPLSAAEAQVVGLYVLQNCTLQDIGVQIGRSLERAREILAKGLRKLRTYQAQLTGINARDIDPRVISLRLWRQEIEDEKNWRRRNEHE